MNTDISIETDCCLLIFDSHQNNDWVKRILEKEEGRFSHLLLGGDYFDGHSGDAVTDAREVCEDLLDWRERFGNAATFLLGNHDIAYLEAIRRWSAGGALRAKGYRCSGYSDFRAAVIADVLGEAFWTGARLFQHVNGWFVSHAGLAPRFWHADLEMDDALRALDSDCSQALGKVACEVFPLLDAGFIRGGRSQVGGITWHDFDREFTDDESLPPQICGHTARASGNPLDRVRRKGRSRCLDGHQTCYGRLYRDGRLEIGVVDPD